MTASPVAAFAVVRRCWPWLLVGVVAVAGAVTIGLIVAAGPGEGAAIGDAPAVQPQPESSIGAPASPTPGSLPPASTPSRGSWDDIARGFGRTFTHTALGQEAWFAAVSSWLTDEQAAVYRDIPIEDIPTGILQEVEIDDPGGQRTTRGLLIYDTGMVLEVGLTYRESAGGWLVSTVRPAEKGRLTSH